MNSDGVNQIVGSLQVIYNPRSSNDDRHKAEQFLEKIKQIPESPFWGYQLALPDNKYDYVVRHYGLNLLLDAITKDYFTWDLEKKLAVRHWVVELASKASPQDPHYMKEKVAFLWVEVAKRCWGQCLVKMDTSSKPVGKSKDDGISSNHTDGKLESADTAKQAKEYSEQEKQESCLPWIQTCWNCGTTEMSPRSSR